MSFYESGLRKRYLPSQMFEFESEKLVITDNFKASLMAYEDEFLDDRTFRWFTKAPRTLESKEVTDIRDLDDLHIHLFIKRKYTNKDNETDFYYMGEMKPIKESITQKQKPTSDGKMKNVVEIDFKLGTAVESNMYEFLTKVVEEKI